jgi:hypothetical protein
MRGLLRIDHAFTAVLFLGLFGMAARTVADPDVWWHLRTGQYISEHKSIPHTDPFSYTRAGEPWVAHEWLTELLLYTVQRMLGWGGLILLFAAVVCAAFYLLYLRCGNAIFAAGPATLLAAWATAPLWGVRPQILSLLLTSLWLLILERSERLPGLLWWTLPLMLLWVNLHAGFVLGLVLSTMFLAGDFIEHRLGLSIEQSAARLRKAALILLLDVLIVPLNPNGLRMFAYPVETLRSPAMQNYIAEWASPNFHHAEYWPFLLLVLITLAALSWSSVQVRPRDLLLLLVTLFAGLSSIRLIPLFVLIALPLICRRLGNWPGRSSPPLRHQVASPFLKTMLHGGIVLGMAAFISIHTAHVIQSQPEAERLHFPAGAVSFLRDHPPAGPLFNHYDWGGYLIWNLYPSTHVFIDGRADLYAQLGGRAGGRFDHPPLLNQFADTYQFKGDWRQSLECWHIGTVLVPGESALAVGLGNAPGWTVAYEDSQAVILTTLAQPLPEEIPGGRVGLADPHP